MEERLGAVNRGFSYRGVGFGAALNIGMEFKFVRLSVLFTKRKITFYYHILSIDGDRNTII